MRYSFRAVGVSLGVGKVETCRARAAQDGRGTRPNARSAGARYDAAMVALLEFAVFAEAPLVPVATARNLLAPATAANARVTVPVDTETAAGGMARAPLEPPRVGLSP